MNDVLTRAQETEINEHLYFYDQNIVLWEEYSRPTVDSVEKLSNGLAHLLSESNEPVYMIFDLRKVNVPPNSEIRSMLKITFDKHRDKLKHGCVIVPNTFMKMTAKLIMKSYFNSISYHTTMDDALDTVSKKEHNYEPNRN